MSKFNIEDIKKAINACNDVRKACKELNVSRWGLYKFIKEEGYRIEKKIGLVRIDE